MLAALIMLLSFLGKAVHRWAALIGGLGFGVFIDEIGKFVTADNDYFFRPAVSLIYVVFVLTFLAMHLIHSRPRYCSTEYLMNALNKMEEVVFQDLDSAERRQALALLRKCDPNNPLVSCLTDLMHRTDLVERGEPGWWERARTLARRLYRRIARLPQFPSVVICIFVIQLLLKFLYVGHSHFSGWNRLEHNCFRAARRLAPWPHRRFDVRRLRPVVLFGTVGVFCAYRRLAYPAFSHGGLPDVRTVDTGLDLPDPGLQLL